MHEESLQKNESKRLGSEPVTFQLHSGPEALVEPASRALLPGGDGDGALGPAEADVVLLVLDRPLEEALAALAGEDAVVESGDLVAANRTRTEIVISC